MDFPPITIKCISDDRKTLEFEHENTDWNIK